MASDDGALPGTRGVQSLVSGLGTLLRYFAPGFAVLFVAMAFNPDSISFGKAKYTDPVILVGAAFLGVGIYGIHVQFLHQLFWRLALLVHRCRRDDPDLLETDDKTGRPHKEMSISELCWTLTHQRWRRRASSDPQLRGYQGELSKWGALLHLLFCSSYALVVVPIVLGMPKHWWWSLGIGVFMLLFVALPSNHHISHFELRATRIFFVPNPTLECHGYGAPRDQSKEQEAQPGTKTESEGAPKT